MFRKSLGLPFRLRLVSLLLVSLSDTIHPTIYTTLIPTPAPIRPVVVKPVPRVLDACIIDNIVLDFL